MTNKTVDSNIKGTSIYSVFFLTGIVQMIDVTPSIKAILAMFEPTTLPMAIPELPTIAACVLTNNSGMEVPKQLAELESKEIRFTDSVSANEMPQTVLESLGIK